MTTPQANARDTPYAAQVFRYDDCVLDATSNSVTCRYTLDDWHFEERFVFPEGGDWQAPAVREAARLLFLLAGVSYYKAGAPPVIDLGQHGVTDRERAFLREFYIDGLGEFAYRSEPRLDLSGLEIRGLRLDRDRPVDFSPSPGTPLIPFGGGVDSIVTTEILRPRSGAPSLFVVNRPGDRFDAIEQPGAVAGLPMVRAERMLDPQILRSRELGFRNGHVPVTGVISAIGVLAAVLGRHDAVVMSNEWSASVGTVEVGGRSVNHQYSKSMAFETGFGEVLADALGGDFHYFSMLRPYTELYIAQEFSRLGQYFDTFRSCNRAFHIDRGRRLDHWCGRCDKCSFIDLILSPFVDAPVLRGVFAAGGAEPLENPDLASQFDNLLGLVPGAKPWECVGDDEECRIALRLASARTDRAGSAMIAALLASIDSAGLVERGSETLLRPVGQHRIPAAYLPENLREKLPENLGESVPGNLPGAP